MAENYIFTYDQLKALLVGYGYKGVSGLALGNSVIGYQELIEALNQLQKNGMLSSDGKKFEGSETARKISERLGEAVSYTVIHTKKRYLPDLCCYCGDDLLICSYSLVSNNFLSLRFSAFDDFYESLGDEGYLPDGYDEVTLEIKELEDFEEGIFSNYNPNYPIQPDSSVIFAAEKIDCKGNVMGYVRILEYYLYNYILCFHNNKTERVFYDKSIVKEFLKGLLDQDDNC